MRLPKFSWFEVSPNQENFGFSETQAKVFFKEFSELLSHFAELYPRLRSRITKGPRQVYFVSLDKKSIQKANREFRKKTYAPDVLSFLNPESAEGEVLLCLPVIRIQAKAAGVEFQDELKMLMIHGFLHLLGYEHEKTQAQARQMYSMQNKLVKQLAKTAPLF